MAQSALKFAPYGIVNYQALRSDNFAYVDKTKFIAKLEDTRIFYPFIVRPRRFGKTLFTQTLQAYYDIAAAKDYLADTIGISRTSMRSTKSILQKAAENGIEFVGL